jgi:hypothetical protein
MRPVSDAFLLSIVDAALQRALPGHGGAKPEPAGSGTDTDPAGGEEPTCVTGTCSES